MVRGAVSRELIPRTRQKCVEEEDYRLVAYPWGNDGNLSLPRQATVGEQMVLLPVAL
jgi:hypothetical protein